MRNDRKKKALEVLARIKKKKDGRIDKILDRQKSGEDEKDFMEDMEKYWKIANPEPKGDSDEEYEKKELTAEDVLKRKRKRLNN